MASNIAEYRKRNQPIVEFWGPTRLVFGWDSIKQLAKIVDSLGAESVLLVVDQHVLDDHIIQSSIADLQCNSRVVLSKYNGAEPSFDGVARLIGQSTGKIDALVAIGGGSTIDITKAAALAMATKDSLGKFEGANRIDMTLAPIVAIPSTAGTGSEVTGSCVLTDESDERKASIRSPKLLPRLAILDPHILASVPRTVIRATGVDALAHAMEAYFSTGGSALTDTIALGAMRYIINALPLYYANPADREAAEQMAWGSCMAGIAFNSARVGLAHAVASAIGPLTKLSHGLCVGLGLPEAIRLNAGARTQDRHDLLAHLGVSAASDGYWQRAIGAKIGDLYERIHFPKTAREAGASFRVTDDLLRRIISSGRLETNPAPIESETLREVLTNING